MDLKRLVNALARRGSRLIYKKRNYLLLLEGEKQVGVIGGSFYLLSLPAPFRYIDIGITFASEAGGTGRDVNTYVRTYQGQKGCKYVRTFWNAGGSHETRPEWSNKRASAFSTRKWCPGQLPLTREGGIKLGLLLNDDDEQNEADNRPYGMRRGKRSFFSFFFLWRF